MTADEIAQRIAFLYNPMPDMSGRQINRLHGDKRRQVEDLAAELSAENATLLAALKAMDEALTEAWGCPADVDGFEYDGSVAAWIQIRAAISQADGR